jgi:small-conductance mechanosensitive channel
MVFGYLHYVLQLFPWTRGAAGRLVAVTADPVRNLAQGVVDTIPNVVFLALLFLLARYFLSLVHLFFDSVGAGTVQLHGFEREWAAPTYRLVRLAIVAFVAVMAYPYIPGSGTDAFKGISVFVGILFSIGSSSLVGNVLAGYSLMYRRTFRIGDRVRIGDHLGEVLEMRLLGTHLRTWRNEIVTVPNSVIVNTEVTNYSTAAKREGLILSAEIGIGYETPWRQVEALLLEAAARTPGLLPDHQPFVHHTVLGEFSVTYQINVYCDAPERMRSLNSDLRRNILDVFNEYGVQIMTPAYEGDPQTPKIVPKERWFVEPARRNDSKEHAARTLEPTQVPVRRSSG